MLLTICIPSITSRNEQFIKLFNNLHNQIIDWKLSDKAHVIHEIDNKEISIGAKRQKMYECAKGKFCVQIDDDDSVAGDYVNQVVTAIEQNPDADFIGSYESCNVDGDKFLTKHSNVFPDWCDYKVSMKKGICRYGRTPFMKDPILTEHCLKIGVQDMRFAEDHDFARRLKVSGLIKNEVFIDDILYYYNRISTPHEERYGIKR